MTKSYKIQGSLHTYNNPHCTDKRAFSMIRSLDHRLKLSDDMIPLLNRELSPADKGKLFNHLKSFIISTRDVEKDLMLNWGIPRTVKEIEILMPGAFNNAIAGYNSIQVLVGEPKKYDSFFSAPGPLYAHELGHNMFFYDGNDKLSKYATVIECDGLTRKDISPDGKLKRKYFEDIPYNILPKELLFPKKAADQTGFGLMYFTDELIADKVALQICGDKETSIHIKRKVKERIEWFSSNEKNPWEYLFCITLSGEFKLGPEEKILRQGLAGMKCPWQSSISTEDLLNKMSEFFRTVSLKHQ